MGYAISWLAVEQDARNHLVKELGLDFTHEARAFGDALLTGGDIPSRWFVLFINRCDHEFVQRDSLLRLSRSRTLVACSVEEHVMYSSAQLWRDGTLAWRLEHSAEKGLRHLAVSGVVPDAFLRIRAELEAKQASAGEEDVDFFFDIPLATAQSLVGFRHDEPGSEGDITVFTQTGHRQHPWWRFR